MTKECTGVKAVLQPTWVQVLNDEEYSINFWRIYRFFLINAPCKGQSFQRIPLEKHGWKDMEYMDSPVFSKMLTDYVFDGNEPLFITSTKKEFASKIKGELFSDNFSDNYLEQRIAITNTGNCKEVAKWISLFYHIRNALAHSRFSVFPIHSEEDRSFVLEDGFPNPYEFDVNARIVLYESTLLKIIDFIENHAPRRDYLEELISLLEKSSLKTSEIVSSLKIPQSMWESLRDKHAKGMIHYKNNMWSLKDNKEYGRK